MPLLFLACSDELTPVIQPSSPFPSKVFRMKYNTLQICGEGMNMISHIQNDSSILTNMVFDRAVRRMTATSRRNPYTIFQSFFSECWALEAGGDSLVFLIFISHLDSVHTIACLVSSLSQLLPIGPPFLLAL